ncbi:hypothetical protein BDP27DRAFT_1373509 [Rhodocollybia butyracea]|uniref:Uncharacterized protein n=1 Tax=Rhodocollybia butyracea TaxID=206335 RepID=A0A9P5P6Z5_9AGAR|nr:hypothetical protein BDP27DRAFT_1373509 [Rhodocollybia butyracea]
MESDSKPQESILTTSSMSSKNISTAPTTYLPIPPHFREFHPTFDVHTVTRFAISAADKWDGVNGHFNYVKFYMEMVKYFKEYPKDTKVVNLLEWWNERISYYLQ